MQTLYSLRNHLFFLTVLIFSLGIHADCIAQRKKAKPKWTDYFERTTNYPSELYVTGFTSEKGNDNESDTEIFDRLKNHARTQLVESIQVTIKSLVTSDILVENTETVNKFRKTSVSLSKVDISGLTIETFYDEKEDIYYAFAYAKRKDILAMYKNRIAQNKKKTENYIQTAKDYLTDNNRQNALKTYYRCIPLFRETEEAQSIVVALANNMQESGLYINEMYDYNQQVSKAIQDIQKSDQLSLSDVSYFMASGIKYQLEKTDVTIRLVNFTYEDSRMASSFSKRFTDMFEKELIGQKLQVIRNPASIQKNGNSSETVLTGTYWKEDKYIKIIAILRDSKTQQAIASSEGLLPVKWLEDRDIEYKPNNYDDAVKKQKEFQKNDLVSTGLTLEVTTNHGNQNPIFIKGDTLKLYLRVNRASYIRVIYHFADGNKVLLLDNYHIDNRLANKAFEIPQYFECVEPFGIETLQVNAQTKPFAPLKTKKQYGHLFVVNELEDILENVRGFKPVEHDDANAEKRVTITTLATE